MKKNTNKTIARIHLQNASKAKHIPTRATFLKWIKLTLQHLRITGEITVRVVDKKESAALNEKYRHKKGPTNVLAFPFNKCYLGDIIICASLVKEQAQQQHKLLMAHWAHLTIHGTLHLLGYDHVTKKQANEMEKVEILLLERLGFTNPYLL